MQYQVVKSRWEVRHCNIVSSFTVACLLVLLTEMKHDARESGEGRLVQGYANSTHTLTLSDNDANKTHTHTHTQERMRLNALRLY
jgi:hypothetical protein